MVDVIEVVVAIGQSHQIRQEIQESIESISKPEHDLQRQRGPGLKSMESEPCKAIREEMLYNRSSCRPEVHHLSAILSSAMEALRRFCSC